MKIYELPYEIRRRVFQLQIEAGNKPDPSLELTLRADQGNFDWHKTEDRWRFWDSINSGYWKTFYKKYPNALFDNTAEAKKVANEILNKCPINLSDHSSEELFQSIVHVLKFKGGLL